MKARRILLWDRPCEKCKCLIKKNGRKAYVLTHHMGMSAQIAIKRFYCDACFKNESEVYDWLESVGMGSMFDMVNIIASLTKDKEESK